MKVLIHKETKLYGHYMGNGEFAISEHPYIFPDTMTRENFISYVKLSEGCDLNINDYDVKSVELIIFDE